MTDPTLAQWAYLALGAMGIGFSKAGFPGVSMLHVVVFALVFGAKASTGILLPMLIVGDLFAIVNFGRSADWGQIRKLLPPTLVGIVLGFLLMGRIDEAAFRWIVATIILTLCGVQAYRMAKPDRFKQMPKDAVLAIMLGSLGGISTMLANAAGPVIGLYLLVVALPKMDLIGTSAWLFLVLNVFKLPFSYNLGLIHGETLWIGLQLAIAIPIGMAAGRYLVTRISQKTFNVILLAFTAVMATQLVWNPFNPPATPPPSAGSIQAPPAARTACRRPRQFVPGSPSSLAPPAIATTA